MCQSPKNYPAVTFRSTFVTLQQNQVHCYSQAIMKIKAISVSFTCPVITQLELGILALANASSRNVQHSMQILLRYT